MAQNILGYNQALDQYNAGNYGAAQQTAKGSSGNGWADTSSLFAAPKGSSTTSSPTPAPTPQNTGQQSQVNLPSIDDIFGSASSMLNDMTSGLSSQRDQGHKTVDSNYAGQKSNITGQITDATNQLTSTGQKLDQNLGSAYSQAQNTYNQLVQRNLNQYGGRGIGQALNAILGQGYQQNLGQLSNQDLNSHQDLSNEKQHLTQWGDTQNNNLDNWKNQAYQSIDQIFNDGMNKISGLKYQNEQGKAQAKLSLLQDVLAQRNAVDQYHQQLATQLALTSGMGNNLSAYGGANYSPTGYQSAIQGALSNVAQIPTALQQYTAQNTGGNTSSNPGWIGNSSDDITKQLFGI